MTCARRATVNQRLQTPDEEEDAYDMGQVAALVPQVSFREGLEYFAAQAKET